MTKLTRRQAFGTVAGAAAGIAVAGIAIASANATPDKAGRSTTAATGTAAGTKHHHTAVPAPFSEVFEGRRIQGIPGDANAKSEAHGQHHTSATGYRVLIDGRELHVMQKPDSSWTSVMNHYQTFPDPHTTARAAVTSLMGADLVPHTPTA
ncbi:tyrosinase cofactor [Streptomyces uncialis]|uniref:apotyrosinase chaperone MelC1 n=1 Tax=Streptomyces uncialis TaxID=1048205 RepID=UPI002E37BC26|nr:tyrosinase family oxidase copper chaperone [Streptomyces uncialis]